MILHRFSLTTFERGRSPRDFFVRLDAELPLELPARAQAVEDATGVFRVLFADLRASPRVPLAHHSRLAAKKLF